MWTSEYTSYEPDSYDDLSHFGVKGMRWGHRANRLVSGQVKKAARLDRKNSFRSDSANRKARAMQRFANSKDTITKDDYNRLKAYQHGMSTALNNSTSSKAVNSYNRSRQIGKAVALASTGFALYNLADLMTHGNIHSSINNGIRKAAVYSAKKVSEIKPKVEDAKWNAKYTAFKKYSSFAQKHGLKTPTMYVPKGRITEYVDI